MLFKNTSKKIMSICASGRGFTVCFSKAKIYNEMYWEKLHKVSSEIPIYHEIQPGLHAKVQANNRCPKYVKPDFVNNN